MESIGRTPKQIGEVIRRYRRGKGLTQKKLGEQIGLRQATISKLESGESGTQIQTILDALVALDLEIYIRPRTKASPKSIEDIF